LLQPFGTATATADGTTGLVQGATAGKSEYLLRGDRTWQNPLEFVNSLFQQVVQALRLSQKLLLAVKQLAGAEAII
jgi:hypothetical protein